MSHGGFFLMRGGLNPLLLAAGFFMALVCVKKVNCP